MTKSKNTKRALLASVLSMVLCLVMLTGSTFAWLSASKDVTAGTIQIGGFDLNVTYQDDSGWVDVTDKTLNWTLNSEGGKWIPGTTGTLPLLKVENTGAVAQTVTVTKSGASSDSVTAPEFTIQYGSDTEETFNRIDENGFSLAAGATMYIKVSGTLAENLTELKTGTIDDFKLTIKAEQQHN